MLVLFDIDGTLLLAASAEHRAALLEALHAVHGVRIGDEHGVATAGRTDPAITRSLLLAAGLDATRIDARVDAVRDAACAAYASLCPADLSGHVAPGARAALGALEGAGHRLSLVTGNLEPIARLKLARAGLGARFARGQGGFGSDHEDRAALPAVARHRAGDEGRPHPRADTVVVGDTPLDIMCARADGIRVIAVATGPHCATDLREADLVIEDLHALPGALVDLG